MNDNDQITNINHLSKLTKLYCSRSSLTQEGIKHIFNLKYLDISYNYIHTTNTINDLNHMEYLEELNCEYTMKIKQKSISKLNKIRILNMSHNRFINELNHMTNLIELNCEYSEIKLNGIFKLTKIRKLNVNHSYVICLNHMKDLEELHCEGPNCGIDNFSINRLYNIRKIIHV